MTDRNSPLYRLEAFGLQNPWVLWELQQGALGEWCTGCKGAGIIIDSPCQYREPPVPPMAYDQCDRAVGCEHCRRGCPFCHGRRLSAAPPVLAEDFGDREDYEQARRMFPGLKVGFGKRSDRAARAM